MAEVEKKFLSRIGVHATHYKWARQACGIREVECIIIGCRSRGCVGVPGRGVADLMAAWGQNASQISAMAQMARLADAEFGRIVFTADSLHGFLCGWKRC